MSPCASTTEVLWRFSPAAWSLSDSRSEPVTNVCHTTVHQRSVLQSYKVQTLRQNNCTHCGRAATHRKCTRHNSLFANRKYYKRLAKIALRKRSPQPALCILSARFCYGSAATHSDFYNIFCVCSRAAALNTPREPALCCSKAESAHTAAKYKQHCGRFKQKTFSP